MVDCINEQLKYFDNIENIELSNYQRQCKRIKRSRKVRDGDKKRYSEEVIEQYKEVYSLDDCINDYNYISEVKSGYIKKYFLAKQLNQVLSEYDFRIPCDD